MRILKLPNIKFNSFQKDALLLTKKIQAVAPKTYWVGGAVRDLLLGRKNSDIDIATAATPRIIKSMLIKMGMPFFNVGEKFGTIGSILSGGKVEITTFRAEKGYRDSRHPDKVKFVSDPEDDARRRDLTINALFFDPVKKEVMDYSSGFEDIKNKSIRFVGSAETRIKEDPLRALRAIRFASILNFKIKTADFAEIKKLAHLLKKVSGTRIKEEIDKIMLDGNFVNGIKLLDSSGVLLEILPEMARLKKVRQSRDVHAEGDVFTHTVLVLENLNKIGFGNADLSLRYAALFHDFSKFGTSKKIIKNGRIRISFYGHEATSLKIFKEISKRIPFSAEQSKKISYLVAEHGTLDSIDVSWLNKDKKLFMRWAQKPYFAELVMLRIADGLGAVRTDARGKKIKKNFEGWAALLKKARKWQGLKSKKFISGEDVMEILKIKPGKKVGEVLGKILILEKSGKIKNRQQGITFLKSLDKDAA